MDILKILEAQSAELIPEDLDFFEAELATGGPYDEAYQSQCRKRIKELRSWLASTAGGAGGTPSKQSKAKPSAGLVLDVFSVAPKEANPIAASLSPSQIILEKVNAIRLNSAYKTAFKKYVAATSEIDAAFVEKHYAFFHEWEINAIISVKQMGEDFLEKYFGALDHAKIARYQLFSEEFFIKHFAQLDANIVLLHGKNGWRKKENRSTKLNVFLQLKGVQI